MAEIEPTQFSGFPYYDDYLDEKKFLKMLFKPGYALQARELTQAQTILQKQISRFANHIFKDGSPVVDGQLGVVSTNFIRVDTTVTGPSDDIVVNPLQFVGKVVSNVVGDSGVPRFKMKVIHAESATEKDPYHVLFVEYLNAVTVIDQGVVKNETTLAGLYDAGDPITLAIVDVVDENNEEVASSLRCNVKTDNPRIATFGGATLISNRDGIYYVDGAFVMASSQTIALSRLSRTQSDVLGTSTTTGIEAVESEWSTAPGDVPEQIGTEGNGWSFSAITGSVGTSSITDYVGIRLYQFPSVRVGFSIKREVIDADADTTLLDPAYGAYNYAAPGADRYKIDLILGFISFTNKDALADSDQYKTSNFIELTRIIDGITKFSVKYPIYSDIEETLARRTYDESGSYTIRPFEVDIQEYFNDEKMCVLRNTVVEIQGNANTVPYDVLTGGSFPEAPISTGYTSGISVFGYRNSVLAWKGLVSNADTFLDRQGELDFREEGYGTTLLYMVFGVPVEGDVMVSESYTKPSLSNKFFLKATIPALVDIETDLYTTLESEPRYVLAQTSVDAPVLYKTVYPIVSVYSDPRFNGKFTLGRLHPEWSADATDPSTEEISTAINEAKDKLSVGVGTGKAYVFGYEFENQNTKYLPLEKARDIETVVGETVSLTIGNYVICESPLGDLNVSDATATIPSWSSLPQVELWNTVSPDGFGVNANGNILIGTARVRGVSPTLDGQLNVHICDVKTKPNQYFSDFDQIRFRYINDATVLVTGDNIAGSIECFNISITGGPGGSGGTIKTTINSSAYYDTVLFGTKNNLALFDLPSLCSIRDIEEFAKVKYDCKKTFNKKLSGIGPAYTSTGGLQFKSYGTVWILSNNAGAGVLANNMQPTASNTDYTFKSSGFAVNSTLGNILLTAIGANQGFVGIDPDSATKYMLFDEHNGKQYDLSDPTGPFRLAISANKKILYIVYAPVGGDTLDLASKKFQLEAVMSVQTTAGNMIDFRTKRATVINEYSNVTNWSKYFDPDGYFMLPLHNWDGIFNYNNTSNDDPYNVAFVRNGNNGWVNWTGDDDQTGNANGFGASYHPDEYATNLGVSDVLSVDEVLVWDNTANVVGNINGKRDITKYFEVIHGTNDNFYDHAKIVIKRTMLQELKQSFPGIFKNAGDYLDYTLFVRFKFFKHSGSGPFVVNSYEHDNHHPFFHRYEDIPLYTSPTYGSTYELRNCLDYRPSRETSTPAVVAVALANAVTVTGTGNRPQAYDIDCPLRDNSLVDGDSIVSLTSRSDSETIPPALGSLVSAKPAIKYNYYTSRRDKLVVRKNRKFELVSGKSSVRPESPKDIPESMSLYNITVPQYTFGPEDVLVDYIDNKRFTMNDIGKLEKRIERVEYYTALSLLEKEANEIVIPDSSLGGQERIKNGIFVDNFKGHSVGDVFNPYYSCSMDFANGHLRPRFTTRNVAFTPDLTNTDFIVSPDGVVTLQYSVKPNQYIVQPLASRAISVNPFDVVSWLGSVVMAPSSDTWVDTKKNPTVTINLEGENDAWAGMQNAFGTQWNDWETNWSGVVASTTENLGSTATNKKLDAPHTRKGKAPLGQMKMRNQTTTTRTSLVTETLNTKQTREGIKTTITPQRVTKELGDRTVDVSVVPYIRNRSLVITGKGLKPNTILHAFFDSINVNKYCFDETGGAITSINPILTNSAGEVSISFELPAGVFKTGERQFRLTDSTNNDITKSNTSAEASYFAQGLLQTKENTIISTRVPVITRETVTDDRVVRDVVTRVQTDSSSTIKWVDPLAQTFLVDVAKNPKGVWVHSIDLFFKNKPTSNIPVRVQIRPTVNGYPHSSMVIPFADVMINAESVNLSQALASDGSDAPNINNSNTYTRFKFSTPVYLMPGEYALVVMSNSNEYECYVAEMGETVVGSTARITQQPYAGVFFKSQNASTWSADQNTDLMFALNTCVFTSDSSTTSINFAPIAGASEGFSSNTTTDYFLADAAKIIAQYLRFDGANIRAYLEYGSANNRLTLEVPLNENFAPRPNAIRFDATTRLRFDFENTDQTLSPCVDSDRVSLVLIDNIIGSPTASDNNTEEWAARPLDLNDREVSRYISRRVDLVSGLDCDDIKVYLSANLPNYIYINGESTETSIETDVEVWLKVQTADSDIPFDDLNWMKMDGNPLQANQVATDEVTFTEYSFTVPEKYYPSYTQSTGYLKSSQSFSTPFIRYSVKVVLYSNVGTIVPKIKDLRVIAVV